jgi:hypothetical protein
LATYSSFEVLEVLKYITRRPLNFVIFTKVMGNLIIWQPQFEALFMLCLSDLCFRFHLTINSVTKKDKNSCFIGFNIFLSGIAGSSNCFFIVVGVVVVVVVGVT